MLRSLCLWLVLLGSCAAFLPAQAQQTTSTPPLAQRELARNASATKQLRVRPDGTPTFPNVNRLAFYQNKKELKAIQQAEKRHNWGQARKLLAAYVGKFGIENFARNTDMLWRLGQLYERTDNEQQAKIYYSLALKHRRRELKKVQLYYDSLEQKTADLYVPMQEYYAMVEYRKNLATFHPPVGVYTSMGAGINSPVEDYGPALSSEAGLFVFSSKRKVRGNIKQVVDEDLYTSRREGEYWTDAEPLPKPINSQYNEGSACFSHDGKTIYFARCECPDCHGNCDLYSSTFQDGQWSTPKSLGPNVNSVAWDSQPTLSPNEDTLYFASDRLGGFGLSDIWYTYKTKNGEWAKAENMGPVVNTRESEVSPFYHPLYNVLYFSSRGQLLNFGDFDIYKTYRVNGRWQEPRNIGPLVNGKGSEYYFTIDRDSKNLYYARAEAKTPHNLDLYSFPLPMEAQPLATTHFEGSLVDSVTNKPLNGIVSIIDTNNGIEVASKYLRPDGSFDFDLMEGSHYVMLIRSPDYFTVEKQFDLKSDTLMKLMTASFDSSLPLIFRNIEFEATKANVLSTMHGTLDRIALFMVDHPTYRLSITGHTDARGNPDVNEKLSQDRAEAIRRYIEQKGKLQPNRIDSNGLGSTKPLKEEVTEEDAKVNRRVEFQLIKPEGESKKPAASGGSDW
ncbi:OmpA family protein [Hymenobacter aerilatus]|uniref:OmpA family protein n=1 Tax=Hymenobacter aerilatus TaxID=2932251 RepID=A0A8T9SW98_9BACT|nr:OmpA family protein [Hymenobacter aerilatus]UOR05681.1 OmpA family protein [Hymenobacter aerilatus]